MPETQPAMHPTIVSTSDLPLRGPRLGLGLRPLLRERRGAHRRFFLAFLPKAALCCPFWGYTNNVLTKYKYTRAACTL